ncbi:MAG: hypothetical protein U1F68_17355 [Gammaproteobacteria bacterium]
MNLNLGKRIVKLERRSSSLSRLSDAELDRQIRALERVQLADAGIDTSGMSDEEVSARLTTLLRAQAGDAGLSAGERHLAEQVLYLMNQ